ncbi:MAG TPA: transporter substrate-binding domain-containing protein [Oligoflexus sp.]|uniref:substrate-binding periplasmic protein n=1 Tax=Oligoflexus sp. TaxID=1971216 RepID=UPI002D802370|nr:transporter substrate-binding domain-containing protein [Oligoflexus sp.]HET9239930.1 transporter substrate-binding domain-containing protein [Oligoflexus sp.]
MRVLLLSLLLCSEALFAQKKPRYTIAVENQNYMPYFRVDGNEYLGFARELFDLFAADAGIEFEYVPNPIHRIYANYFDKKSTLDFKFPDRPEWASDLRKGRTLHYTDDIVEFTDGVMVRPKNLGKGLKGLTKLGMIAGFTPFQYAQYIKSEKNPAGTITLVPNTSLSALFAQLEAENRIDGVFINLAVAKYSLVNDQKKVDLAVFDKELPHDTSSYQLSTTKHPDIVNKFNEFMKKKKSEVAVLKQKWGL